MQCLSVAVLISSTYMVSVKSFTDMSNSVSCSLHRREAHRRNNCRNRGRLIPQLLGWATASSHQNAGFSIWVFKKFPAVIPLDPHRGRGRPPPAAYQDVPFQVRICAQDRTAVLSTTGCSRGAGACADQCDCSAGAVPSHLAVGMMELPPTGPQSRDRAAQRPSSVLNATVGRHNVEMSFRL